MSRTTALMTLLGLVVGVSFAATADAAQPESIALTAEHELLIDDYLIEKSENLTRRVIPATKHAKNPVLVGDRPWELQGFVTMPSVYYDPQRKCFRMWYLVYNVWWSRHALDDPRSSTTKAASSAPATTRSTGATTATSSAPTTATSQNAGPATSSPTTAPAAATYYEGRELPNHIGTVPMADSAFLCYAESKDGVQWDKPELGIVEFQGGKKNNIVLRHRGSHFDSFSVIWRPDWKKPEERYVLIAFVGTWPYDPKKIAARGLQYGIKTAGHYVFTSADGINWKPHWDKPAVPLSQAQDRTTWSWDARHGRFVGNLKWTKNGVRCRRQAVTQDLWQWPGPQLILVPDKQDPSDAQFYGHYTFGYGRQYLGWLELYRPGPGTIDFQLIAGRDGTTWSRVADRGVFVARGQKGAFDSTMIMVPGSPPIAHADRLWIYYFGSARHHNDRGPERGAIGLATTRPDGFVALEAAEKKEGRLVTKPLSVNGTRLFINVDAQKGAVRAEVLDAKGKPLPGFEAAKSLPVSVDAATVPLTWQGDPGLPTDKEIKLVLHLLNAKLYAIWCQ